MVKISDMAAFVTWCKENGENPADRKARVAYQASQKPGSTGRTNKSRDAIVISFGTLPDGTEMFLRQTCSYRNRLAAAELLEWTLQTEHECSKVHSFVGESVADSGDSE